MKTEDIAGWAVVASTDCQGETVQNQLGPALAFIEDAEEVMQNVGGSDWLSIEPVDSEGNWESFDPFR